MPHKNHPLNPSRTGPGWVDPGNPSDPYRRDGFPDGSALTRLNRGPATLDGFGPKRVIPYTRCEACATSPGPDVLIVVRSVTFTVPPVAGTWTAYGAVPLCLRHAR